MYSSSEEESGMRSRVNLLWVLLLAVAIVAVGCSKASQPYQSGKLYFSQKLYDKAAEQFELAVLEDPASGRNHLELAKCYGELDDNEKAGKNFKLAVEKEPILQKEVSDAVKHYRAEHYNHAVELMKEKSYGDAVAELQEAIYLDDTDPNQYINMGVCYSELKQTDLAVQYYEKALMLSPDDEMARANLVGTFANQAAEFRKEKSYDQATKFYRKVLELSIEDETFDAENASGAELMNKVKGDEDAIGYVFDLGITYLDMAEDTKDDATLAQASEIFGAMYEANPADDDALFYHAYSKMIAEDYAGAIGAYGQLLDRSPREATYYMNMATAYVKGGGSDNEMQMKGVLYFALAKALGSDNNKLAKKDFKDTSILEKRLKEKYSTWKDMKKVMDGLGAPEDIYAYQEDSGSDVECWFYWGLGEAAVFTNGYETGKINFAPQE
jgi:tetratricopeptide (TPR) repeat protein